MLGVRDETDSYFDGYRIICFVGEKLSTWISVLNLSNFVKLLFLVSIVNKL